MLISCLKKAPHASASRFFVFLVAAPKEKAGDSEMESGRLKTCGRVAAAESSNLLAAEADRWLFIYGFRVTDYPLVEGGTSVLFVPFRDYQVKMGTPESE